MRSQEAFSAFILAAFLSIPAAAPLSVPDEQTQAEVLILGVWHMANSTDGPHDVLAPRRQAEIADVLAALERFQPTKIAIEAAFYRGGTMSKLYRAYLDGEHELTRNERQQIGFRLARALGHDDIYSVDADGDFPYPRVEDYAKARGHAEALAELNRESREAGEAWHAFLASHTLLEALKFMNSDDYAADRLAHDYKLARLGEPWNWAGPDLISDWFRRNMRIYSNVAHLIESPDERVLVIIGAGHLGWLRHNFATDPAVRLRKLGEFVNPR